MKSWFESKKQKNDLRKAVMHEMLDQVEDWQRQYNVDMYSNILYSLRAYTESKGDAFGKERLTEFFRVLTRNYDRFRKEYEFDDMYAERVKLMESCGLDVEQLMIKEGVLEPVPAKK